MVLINGLTIDEINAALIALQRGQGEVVGGVKGTTIQNISISNSSNGSSSPDFTPQINALLDKGEELTEAVQDLKGKQNDMQTELENMGNSLMAHGVKGLFWDSSTNMLSIIMQNNQPLSVEIPSDTVTLTLGDDNVLHFTMGGANDYYPQTIDLTLPYIRSSEKGNANGVATLDSTGRIPYSQLPESAMTFLGEWDASTNTPHLEDGTGVNGDFYVVSAGGTVNFGTVAQPRNITFYPNDRVIYEGENDQWFRLPAGEVRTVNGMSGDVTLNANNIDYSSGVTIKDKIDSIEPVQSDWEEDDPNDPAYIKNKIPIWIESGQADDNMTPVDNVTDGQMRPVTSNAVYDALQNVPTNDAPLGSIVAYWGTTDPVDKRWLVLDGRDTTGTDIELQTHYPSLYLHLGGTNVLPDLRECVPVGIGQNGTDTIATHDVYTLGQFKDDQMQYHKHKENLNNGAAGTATSNFGGVQLSSVYASGYQTTDITIGRSGTQGQSGDTTHGKQKGVNWIIKAVSTADVTPLPSESIQEIEGYVDEAIASAMTGVFPDYAHKELIFNSTSSSGYTNNNYVMPDNGMLIASGYGAGEATSYIYFTCNGIAVKQQGYSDEYICNSIMARKGDIIQIQMKCTTINNGLYFVPCK